MHRRLVRLFICTALLFQVAAGAVWAQSNETTAPLESSLRPVRLQLKWTHQFQFAGFYMALEKGYYRDAGFDVTVIEGKPDVDPVHAVIDGAADFGIGNSGLAIWRAQGAPVTAVAAIFQHSPFVLLARRDESLQSVHDLAGRTLMLEEHAAELLAYLHLERAPLGSMKVIPHTGDIQALIRGEVDAISAYSTTEPHDLQAAGFPYSLFNPRSSGIDFYGDTLFTSEKLAKKEPATVAAFRAASMRGWRYALDNLDEAIELTARYAPRLSRAKLQFEAQDIRRLMLADMVEIGYMYKGRWRHIVEGFAAAGLLKADMPLDDFIFDPDAKPDLTWLYLALTGALLVCGVSAWLIARFAGLNRELKQEIAGRRLLEDELRRLATTDSLTGLFNRRRIQEAVERELERSRRHGHSMALLVVDIDHFKSINDVFGHGVGDRALQLFADVCRLCLRSVDSVGRLGGEEFVVLLPETGVAGALSVAERIRAETAEAAAAEADVPDFTVSIGVALLTDADENIETLLVRADRAMYRAKAAGRNCVAYADNDAEATPSPHLDDRPG